MQLQMFDAYQDRIANELFEADKLVSRLQLNLARMASDESTKPIKERIVNQNRPVSEFGLSESQLRSLEMLRIRTARDFVLQFYLPEQHDLLASLLKMDVTEAKELVDQMSSEMPVGELQLLAENAREPKSYGALPPNQER